MFAFGVGLLLAGCSREGDQASPPAGNEPAAALTAQANANTPVQPTQSGSFSSQLAAKRQTLVAEAVSALQETYTALDLLAKGDSAGAVEALARATGKLDIVLAADPMLALAPVDVRITTHDVIATPEAVTALRRRAEAALDEGRLQDARYLIADLASEHVISVTALPLSSYPAAIKQAAALIHDGKAADAVATLETALSTLVVETTIVPLPLARAEALLARAQPLSEKPQRSADERAQLQRILAEARRQLDLARALGYATRADLDALFDTLETIERNAEGEESGKGLFDRLGELFATANRNSKPVESSEKN